MEVSRYTNIVYIGNYVVLTYIERLFSAVCYFFSYIGWSVNCMNWVSTFRNVFLMCLEIEARFIFGCFKYCPLWKVRFQLSGIFVAFFIWSVSCWRDFFSHFVGQKIVWVESLNHVTYFQLILLVSKFYELSQ